jgi:hypothetical protein
VQALGQVGQAHDLAAKAHGQLLAALQRAVGDGDGLGVLRGEVRGASSIISPAPTNSTLTEPRSSNNWPARRTAAAAMLMECAPISVEVRTSLATAKLRWNIWFSVVPRAPASSAARTASFIWPRIWGSPSTIESSPLATRKAWRAACVFQGVDVGPQHGGGDAAAMGQPVQRMVGLVRLAAQ